MTMTMTTTTRTLLRRPRRPASTSTALHWEDWDETAGVMRIHRKNVRGKLGSVTRKKRAPKEYPVLPELAEILSGTPRAARSCGRGES